MGLKDSAQFGSALPGGRVDILTGEIVEGEVV
jgi:hypothetical protein